MSRSSESSGKLSAYCNENARFLVVVLPYVHAYCGEEVESGV